MCEKVTMKLGNGNTFTMTAKNYSPENKYIQDSEIKRQGLE